MILLSELSRRRIRSIQKLIRVGRNEVVVVLRVDREKGVSIFHPSCCKLTVVRTCRLHRSIKTSRLPRRHYQVRRTIHEVKGSRIYHAARRIQTAIDGRRRRYFSRG